MDQVTLVEDQIDQGRKLVERLHRDGFDVTAACWVKEGESGRWYLYLASPTVDAEGKRNAYGRINATLRQMPQPFSIDPLAIKVVRERSPIAEAVAGVHKRHPVGTPLHFHGTHFGGVDMEAIYVYPPTVMAPVAAAEPTAGQASDVE
jgi:hypothetical protein